MISGVQTLVWQESEQDSKLEFSRLDSCRHTNTKVSAYLFSTTDYLHFRITPIKSIQSNQTAY